MRILTITDDQSAYAEELARKLKNEGYRVERDQTSDQIGSKIKSAQLAKIPWMLVIGNKEVEKGTVSIRYADGKQELGLSIEELLRKAYGLNS